MTVRFAFNPFELLLSLFEYHWPDKHALIDFVVRIEEPDSDEEHGCAGCTSFDDEPPRIGISKNVPLEHAVEVLAHELAHVAVGYDESHGVAWQAAFAKIHEEYQKAVAEIAGVGE